MLNETLFYMNINLRRLFYLKEIYSVIYRFVYNLHKPYNEENYLLQITSPLFSIINQIKSQITDLELITDNFLRNKACVINYKSNTVSNHVFRIADNGVDCSKSSTVYTIF